MPLEVLRFDANHRSDFFRLHCAANKAAWCHCVAWWVPTWEGWGDRTAEQNQFLRSELCDRGEYDGYLLYVDCVPAGWCQVGPRDRLEKLARQFRLAPNPEAWAITCFVIAPAYRGRGLAAYLLQQVLRDLRNRGVRKIEAFPKRGQELPVEDLWTGPETMFRSAGFTVVRDDPESPVLALTW